LNLKFRKIWNEKWAAGGQEQNTLEVQGTEYALWSFSERDVEKL
jgi:hypothetical protein